MADASGKRLKNLPKPGGLSEVVHGSFAVGPAGVADFAFAPGEVCGTEDHPALVGDSEGTSEVEREVAAPVVGQRVRRCGVEFDDAHVQCPAHADRVQPQESAETLLQTRMMMRRVGKQGGPPNGSGAGADLEEAVRASRGFALMSSTGLAARTPSVLHQDLLQLRELGIILPRLLGSNALRPAVSRASRVPMKLILAKA
ncbi:hypothetical protein [Nonomuraea bangladeshensis]|uniref:hypothetical protein n=1 Tax=Nonomuraea bangladeshensis TaxID=404385 RepID=UPI0031D0607C